MSDMLCAAAPPAAGPQRSAGGRELCAGDGGGGAAGGAGLAAAAEQAALETSVAAKLAAEEVRCIAVVPVIVGGEAWQCHQKCSAAASNNLPLRVAVDAWGCSGAVLMGVQCCRKR